jgi:hypothetical protein
MLTLGHIWTCLEKVCLGIAQSTLCFGQFHCQTRWVVVYHDGQSDDLDEMMVYSSAIYVPT